MTDTSQVQKRLIQRMPTAAFVMLCIVVGMIAGTILSFITGMIAIASKPDDVLIGLSMIAGLLVGATATTTLLRRARRAVQLPVVATTDNSLSSPLPGAAPIHQTVAPIAQPAPNPDQPTAEPPLPGSDNLNGGVGQPEASRTVGDAWHYSVGGRKAGPTSAEQLRELYKSNQLGEDTHVWRQGEADWTPIRQSKLISEMQGPPPLAAHLVSNSLVWTVALLPLAFGLLDAIIAEARLQHLASSGWWNALQFNNVGGMLTVSKKSVRGLPWYLYWAVYAGLCVWDERRLTNAGYSKPSMRMIAGGLPPIYLFMRAKMLKQPPYYAIVWIVCFVLAMLI